MADIRIKDLTTTASTTAADDFFAADGATNGTRKLSAYSPSFGGNATVGGTLTVNSTDDASNKDTGSLVLEGGLGVEKNIISGLGLSVRGAVTLPTAWTGAYGLGFEYGSAISRIFFGDGTGYSLKFVSRASSTTTDRMTLTDSGVLSVLGTTASTSTSSGALVVSGGVGVAGNVSSGGQVAATGTGTSGPYIANSAVIDYDSSTARFYGRGPNTSTRPSLGFYSTYSDGAGGLTLMTFNASGAATISTSLTLSNASQSRAAWGDVGAQLSVAGAVITDTSSSGTVSRVVVNSIAASALAASSTTTYTAAASLFVAGAPTANTNVTITNAYAIYTAGGRINFQGLPTSSAGLQAGTLWNDGGTLKVA
jgi:hypothetical protein